MSIYKLVSPREIAFALDKTKPLFMDTETAKYYSDIRLVQLFQEGWDQVLAIDIKISGQVELIWDLIRDCKLVGHNLVYDFYCFSGDCTMFEIPSQWEDTFYLSRLAYPAWQKYSLDVCLTHILGYDPYEKEGLIKKDMQESFERMQTKFGYIEGNAGLRDLTPEQYLYGSIDVFKLPHLYNAVKHMEEDFVYLLDKLTAEHCISMTEVGMPVDVNKLEEIVSDDTKLLAELTKKLPANFNVNSYIQVRKLLGLQYVSDEEALSMVANKPDGVTGEEFLLTTGKKVKEDNYVHSPEKVVNAKLIIEKRKALKRLNFVQRARSFMNEDNRIKAHFSPHAITGRVQSDGENLSQYPRTMKRMWGHTPDSGRILIYADYSQLELRSICAILPERNMETAYRKGIDLHTYASQNLELDESLLPEGVGPRFVAKQLNFLALYGGGKQNFQRTVCKLSNIWLPTPVVSKAFDDWKDGFSDIKAWHIRNGKSKTNMDQTISGRKYKASKYTDLNNIKNQGSGAEVAKLAVHYLYKYGNLKQDYNSFIVNFIHDAVIIDAPDNSDVYKRVAEKLAICFQVAWFQIMKNAPISDLPMPVDVSVNYNWEDIEHGEAKYKFKLEGMATYNKSPEEVINAELQ